MNIKRVFFAMFAMLCTFAAFCTNPVSEMLDRIDPGASKKFVIKLKPGSQDFFELEQKGDKVQVTGNSYVNIAAGVNWYLKHYAGIHLSWNGMTAKLPDKLPPVPEKERRETDLGLRYDFNYCTYSYTMPFWDWERWEKELDWMALHGVNLPLAAVGMECVWRNMLDKLGYTSEEINDFIAGPAFIAWWAMNNLEGWGGPNPDQWYERQEALQKQVLKRMTEYGMKPVLPGYSGMMPHNADEKLGLNITRAAKLWNGFQRPAFLEPTDPKFAEIAKLYYDEQNKLFGMADYYSMDPFHELSNIEGFDLEASGRAVMDQMKAHNPKAKWVVQAWGANPRPAMIDALDAGDLIILDLFSECRPMWGMQGPFMREGGYGKHKWIFCLLENFGGNIGLHGRMDQLIQNFYLTKGNPLAKELVGFGFTPEGTETNPVMYELMSEMPWIPEEFTKEDWLKGYAKARYGVSDPAIDEAWEVLANSIYNCPRGTIQQGTHESIFCARPSDQAFQVSSWSKMKNYYDPAATQQAARLMLSVADKYRGNNNFEYDLVDIVRQAVADQGRVTYNHAIADYKSFNKQGFADNSQTFLRMIQLQDSLLATRPEFKVGRWIEFARNAGDTPEQKDLYEWNARVQITTWGPRECADKGKLRDYAHREWNGLLRDFYYPRWQAYFQSLQTELDGGPDAEQIDFYAMEEPWTLSHNPYPTAPEGDPVDVAKAVFAEIFNSK